MPDSILQNPIVINGLDDFEALAKPRRTRVNKEYDEMIAPPIPAKEGFAFGCDPELVVLNAEGLPVSAAGLIPGTKAEPHKVDFGAVQVDGMLAEFNIDPVTNFADFSHHIHHVQKQMEKMLPPGYSLSAQPSVVFSKELFDSAPDSAKELGCTPDFNAWAGTINPPPNDPENPYLRSAAGHIHIGWTEGADIGDPQHVLNCRDLVKQLDWFLGGWSLRLDEDPTRRKLYGKAGACRFKDYGVEYRVLSNFWVTTPARRLAVWNRLQTAINSMAKGYLPERVPSGLNEQLIQMIDTTTRDKELEATLRYPLQTMDLTHRRF